MRTTLTLDPDVAAKAKNGAVKLGKPLKAVIHEGLRFGRDLVLHPAPSKKYVTKAIRWGCATG